MSVLPRRARLAMAALLEVALNANGAPLSNKTLTDSLQLPPRTLELIMQDLVKAKLLKATRGPKGGYELAKERRRISVAEIVKACILSDEDEMSSSSEILASEALLTAEQACFAALSTLTLDDLCEQAKRAMKNKGEVNSDFMI